MDIHDLEPLLSDDVGNPRRRLRRRNSNTFSSLRRYRCLTLIFKLILIVGTIVLAGFLILYRCPDNYCFAQRPTYTIAPPPAPRQIDIDFISYDTIQHENFEFNINGSDVIVFLHIQKTGGTTFGKHLVNDINLKSPCLCKRKNKKHRKKKHRLEKFSKRAKRKIKCDCFRPNDSTNWLFSRYSTGWKCGLHPDWTELTECVDDYLNREESLLRRRYFYITLLRDPVRRYLSEFKHTQRGATWKDSLHKCNGQAATRAEIPPCYDDLNYDDWSDATLDQFMTCSSNLAMNRQTRMLADLRLVNCYNTSFMSTKARELIMLNSAKTNLEKMAFFGLTERQHESQILFQHTFDLQFKIPFKQNNETTSSNTENDLGQPTIDRITELNHLDVELYEYAKKLFAQRYKEINET